VGREKRLSSPPSMEEFGIEAERYLHEVAAKCGLSIRELYEEWFENKYEREPVDPVRWLNDPYYFGAVGQRTYPGVKDNFYRVVLVDPRPMRVILKGSIGWGKTWLSALLISYMAYELSCLKSPQAYFGLAPMTQISFMNLSVSAQHAQRVLFKLIKDMIDESPYFQKDFPRNKYIQSIIDFPQKMVSIVPGSSSELAPLGENLFGGVIEEANFFQVVKGSSKITNPAEREWDQAKKLHDSIWRRMKSRYQNLGRVPGMLILNSSAKHPDDFLERLSKHADGRETVVFEHSEWETKPESRYSGRKFYLFIGDQHTPPKEIPSEEVENYKKRGEVCAIPIEYKRDFEVDMEGAIRDILGKNVRSLNRFIPDDSRIVAMFTSQIPSPLSDNWPEGIPYDRLLDAVILDRLIKKPPEGKSFDIPRMKLHPGALRCAHIDLSSTGDSTGVAIVHVGQVKEVPRKYHRRGHHRHESEFVSSSEEDDYEATMEVVPIVFVDLVLRINPPSEGEIEFEYIREILHRFRDVCGVRFSSITYDLYGSRESQQLLRKRFGQEVVGHQSADRSPDPYLVLKECIYEGRLKCYPYKPLMEELRTLQRDLRTGKIDHPPGGSKDVSDALACAVFAATKQFDLGVADLPQLGEFADTETLEEKLERETKEWLLGGTKRSRPKRIETEEMQIMKAIMSGELDDEDDFLADDEPDFL